MTSLVPPATSRPDLAIHTHGLTKRFGRVTAVKDLDLAVPAGCIYGFLGPNGAGKTTTVRILSTLLRPDEGHASVLGHDVVAEADSVRAHIALTGQFAALDGDLTGSENLVMTARLLGHRPRAARDRAGELISAFGLADAAQRTVKQYSGGMRRRLDIAASLIAAPDLLFLDEPTTGLDPASRNQVWEIVRALAATGTTVLLTTQYLAEAEELAARVAVISAGRLIAEGTPGGLRAAGGVGTLRLRLADASIRGRAAEVLNRCLGPTVDTDTNQDSLTIAAPDAARAAEALAELGRMGIVVASFSLDQPSLEEVFLALTSDSAVDRETAPTLA